jgi:hypothetical protein
LAYRIVGEVPETLQGKRLLTLDIGSLSRARSTAESSKTTQEGDRRDKGRRQLHSLHR